MGLLGGVFVSDGRGEVAGADLGGDFGGDFGGELGGGMFGSLGRANSCCESLELLRLNEGWEPRDCKHAAVSAERDRRSPREPWLLSGGGGRCGGGPAMSRADWGGGLGAFLRGFSTHTVSSRPNTI